MPKSGTPPRLVASADRYWRRILGEILPIGVQNLCKINGRI
jgi:hypothetical protein